MKTTRKASLLFGIVASTAVVSTTLAPIVSASASVAVGTNLNLTVKSGVSMNIRTAPNKTASIVGVISTGTKFTGTVTKEQWLKITNGKYSGKYVSATSINTWYTYSVVKPVTPPPSVTTIRANLLPVSVRVNAHSQPSTSSSIVASFGRGTYSGVSVGDWIKVGNAYINKAFLNTTGRAQNGVASTLNLCGIPTAYNTPHNISPNYTAKTVRYFNCYALKNLNSLESAYKARFGHYAQIDLGFRSLAEQQYWYKKFGYPRAAIPGTSNHGLGLAIDFSDTAGSGREFAWGGPGFNWLKANGGRYGFTSPFRYGTTGESYHWNFSG